jgi:phage-related protein
MREVRRKGPRVARHLDGEIYEVRADGRGVIYRVLFAPQGRRKQILLSLEAFKKKTQRTPPRSIALAKRRSAIGRSVARNHSNIGISSKRC